MSLLQIPPEILIQIFNHVGSSYFRSDLSRLTVSKQWSKFACPALFQDFYVTDKILQNLQLSPYRTISLSLVKDSAEILDLDLKGFEDWTTYQPPLPNNAQRTDAGIMSFWCAGHGRIIREAWATQLDGNLTNLITLVQQARRLRVVRIKTTSEVNAAYLYLPRHDYLFLVTIRAFLSACNLTSLELDLCGSHLMPPQRREPDGISHICTTIATLLTTLRRLRLRMRTICADVLKLPQECTNLRLSQVLVSLSLTKESPLFASALHTSCCVASSGGFIQMKADLEEQARSLVVHMAHPKMVRILTHSLVTLQLRAFDAFTGRNIRLKEGAAWDDNGELIEDEASSSEESEIPDLSSDDD